MIPNILNLILFFFFILLMINKPRAAVIFFVSLLLFLPLQFLQFGFAFGDHGQYISNFVIFTFLFVIGYFIKIKILGKKITRFDIVILIYLCFVLMTSLLVTKEYIGLSFIALFIRRFATFPLFFFVGKFYLLSNRKYDLFLNLSMDVSSITKYLIFVGIYISGFALIEFLTIHNVFADLASVWTNYLGSGSFQESVTNEAWYETTGFYRYSGVYVESTETAIMLLIAFCFLEAKGNFEYLNLTYYRILLYIIFAGMIILNGTRAVIIATMVVFLKKQLFVRRLRKYYLLSFSIVLLIAVIYGDGLVKAFTESSYFESRISNEGTYLERVFAWERAYELFKEHPLLGIGVGTPMDLYDYSWENPDMYTTHNFYFDKIVITGIVGSIFFIWLIIVCVNNLKYINKNHQLLVVREYTATYLSILIGLAIVYFANMEKPTSGCMFWFMSGTIDYIKSEMNIYA